MRAVILTALLALLAGACGGGATTPPPQGDDPTYPGSDDPELAEHAATAREELAAELGVAEDDLTIVLAERVTWRNGALGCEEQGMSYTQALVEGYRLRIEHDGRPYWYHGEEGRPPFHCPEPSGPQDGGG